MEQYLSYAVSIICALISGIVTYAVSRRQTKNEIEKLIKQHELDMESLREKNQMELEKMNIEHRHELELKEKEFEQKLSSDFMNNMMSEVMKYPEIKGQIISGMSKSSRKKR